MNEWQYLADLVAFLWSKFSASHLLYEIMDLIFSSVCYQYLNVDGSSKAIYHYGVIPKFDPEDDSIHNVF